MMLYMHANVMKFSVDCKPFSAVFIVNLLINVVPGNNQCQNVRIATSDHSLIIRKVLLILGFNTCEYMHMIVVCSNPDRPGLETVSASIVFFQPLNEHLRAYIAISTADHMSLVQVVFGVSDQV